MKYKLFVIGYENNENYQSDLAKFNEEQERNRYGSNRIVVEPRDVIPSTSIELVLTEEQFEKVKESVLTVFK